MSELDEQMDVAMALDQKPAADVAFGTLDAVTESPEEVKMPAVYKQADLKLDCTCGHTTIIETNVPEGLMRYDVYTVEGSNIPFMCEKCGHKLTLYFDQAENPIVDEQPTIEPVQEVTSPEDENNGAVEPVAETEATNDASGSTQEKEVEHESVPEERQA